jgi:hypothetical protein
MVYKDGVKVDELKGANPTALKVSGLYSPNPPEDKWE